jgi:hypothetical protein
METTTTNTMIIAQTILKQIQHGDRWALGAYAAKSYASVSETKERQGGLAQAERHRKP